MKLQNFLISSVLNPLGRLTGRLSPRSRDVLFASSALALIFLSFCVECGLLIRYRYIYTFAIGCVLMLLMILFSLPPTVKPVKPDRFLAFCWFGVGLLTLLSAVIFNHDYVVEAVMYLVLYPVLHLLWNNCDISHIFHLLNLAAILSFLVFFIISLVFYPIIPGQYSGLFTNVNGTASYLALVFCCLMIEIFRLDAFHAKAAGLYCLTGLDSAMLFYTNSRTGQLAAAFAFLLILIVFLKNHKKTASKCLRYNLIPIFLSFILFIPSTIYLFEFRNQISAAVVKSMQPSASSLSASAEPSSSPVLQPSPSSAGTSSQQAAASAASGSGEVSSASSASSASVPSSQAAAAVSSSASGADSSSASSELYGIQKIIQIAKLKMAVSGKNLDQLSTGRTAIWREYWRHVTFWGSGEPEKFFVQERTQYYTTAHMAVMEYAFRSGIPCAVLYILFTILSWLKSIRYARRNPADIFALMPLAVSSAFLVESMLASTNTPYSEVLTLFYFMVQAPLMAAVVRSAGKRKANGNDRDSAPEISAGSTASASREQKKI
jgi:hypothetical protein